MRGHSGMAGEFGHAIFDPDGPSIKSFNKGGISAYVGIDAILRDATLISEFQKWETKKKERLLFEDVLEQIEKGNPALLDVYRKAGRVLGVGISNLIRLF